MSQEALEKYTVFNLMFYFILSDLTSIHIPVSTRRCFDVVTTLLTSKQRCIDVKTTSCACWDGLNPWWEVYHLTFCFIDNTNL